MTTETREPAVPVNWPDGHVSVVRHVGEVPGDERLRLNEIGVGLTDIDQAECVVIRLGNHEHYLHSTTARALEEALLEHEGRAVNITIHEVTHVAGRNANRALRDALARRLSEWNRMNAGRPGHIPV